jgi:T5SS/PEP-CTERM-associated repeat protein
MEKKFASQTAKKLSKNVILLSLTALALYASPGSRGAELCNQILFSSWATPGAGNWFDSSNWCGGVPLCHSFTCISNGGKLHVGYQGTGTLKITNGGLVSTTADADIAAGAGSNGAATVNGDTSQWTATGGLYVGGVNGSPGGTGLLTLSNGGKVSVANVYVYQSGTLTGNGRVGATNGTTLEGTLSPNWTLTINGDLTFTGTAATMQCNVTPGNVGNDAEVTGTATLNDKLSVTMTGDFTSGPNRFTLLHADGALFGQFSSQSITYPTNQGFTPKITYDYDRNNVYLDLVFNQN